MRHFSSSSNWNLKNDETPLIPRPERGENKLRRKAISVMRGLGERNGILLKLLPHHIHTPFFPHWVARKLIGFQLPGRKKLTRQSVCYLKGNWGRTGGGDGGVGGWRVSQKQIGALSSDLTRVWIIASCQSWMTATCRPPAHFLLSRL